MITLKKQCEAVRSFHADLQSYSAVGRHYAGARTIPVDRIVGSVGRAHELRSDFLPMRKMWGCARTTPRYRHIRRLMMGNGSASLDDVHRLSGRYYDHDGLWSGCAPSLPPIELYLLAGRYYVVDGHHRVAAALSLGQLEIDVIVVECLVTAEAPGDAA